MITRAVFSLTILLSVLSVASPAEAQLMASCSDTGKTWRTCGNQTKQVWWEATGGVKPVEDPGSGWSGQIDTAILRKAVDSNPRNDIFFVQVITWRTHYVPGQTHFPTPVWESTHYLPATNTLNGSIRKARAAQANYTFHLPA